MFHSDKAFICEICGKAFRFRSNLAEHRSVHTALKPYVCKFCGKSSRLKGNLTKHILKHHKQEQNAYIGKDDIIIKKGKKSVKDPAAVDFLEKSMIVLTSGTSENPLNLPAQKDEAMDDENQKGRSIFMSLGLDTGSMDLRSTSPEEESIFATHGEKQPPGAVDPMIDDQVGMASGGCAELDCEEGTSSPLNNISTNDHLTSLIAHMSNNTRTQCPECGKHFRKGSSLQVHMTLNHGFPPPGSSISSDDQAEKCSDCGTSAEPGNSQNENSSSAPVHQEIKEIKSMIGELRSAQSTARVEQLLTGLDTRVGRLEKQLEMALNSIYTLVQLQTGINSSVTRFREEACEQLKTVKAMLNESSV
uniref:C2H2-type domain-containing protein n=3 Tax=Onchocerca TaxID=6281 RepID=A0A8R1XRC2_ONCVO